MSILALKADERVADVKIKKEQLCVAGAGFGIHWPDIDEDLSTEGLLRGAPSPELSRSRRNGPLRKA